MKRILMVAFCASLVAIACKKKDDDNNNDNTPVVSQNVVTVNGESFDTPNGILSKYGVWDEDSLAFDWDISLTNLTLQDFMTGGDSTKKDIVEVYLDLNSPLSATETIADGTYELGTDTTEWGDVKRTPFSLVYAGIITKGQFSQEEEYITHGGVYTYLVTEGSVVVSTVGSKRNVAYNLTFENNISVSGSFEGEFEMVDYSDEFLSVPIKTLKRKNLTK